MLNGMCLLCYKIRSGLSLRILCNNVAEKVVLNPVLITVSRIARTNLEAGIALTNQFRCLRHSNSRAIAATRNFLVPDSHQRFDQLSRFVDQVLGNRFFGSFGDDADNRFGVTRSHLNPAVIPIEA